MKNLILGLLAFIPFGALAQYDDWQQYSHFDERTFAYSFTALDEFSTPISPFTEFLFYHDTSCFEVRMDSLNFLDVTTILLSGNIGQYVRGDGSFASFPSIPTNTNQLTNGAGFLVSSDIAGKLNISDTSSMLAPYLTSFTEVDGSTTNEIELPSQTGNSGKVLTTNGSIPSWTTLKRQETYSGTTNSSGEYTVTFGTSFSTAPNIQANIIGGNANQVLTITSISSTGFTVKVVERQTDTILGIVVLRNSTTNVNGASINVLITEQ